MILSTTQPESPTSAVTTFSNESILSCNNNEVDLYGFGDAKPEYGPQDQDNSLISYGSIHGRDNGQENATPALTCPETPLTTPMRPRSTDPTAYVKAGVSPDQIASVPTITRRKKTSSSVYGEDGKLISRPGRRSSIQCGREFKVHLPGKETPVVRRSSITFHDKVQVKCVTSVTDMIPDSEKLWFQKDEYKQIRRKSVELVQRAEKEMATLQILGKLGVPNISVPTATPGRDTKQHRNFFNKKKALGPLKLSSDENEIDLSTHKKRYCLRGLEKLLSRNHYRSKLHRMNATDTVLAEQYYQRNLALHDDEDLAEQYKLQTIATSVEAAQRGEEDAQEIVAYLAETRRQCRRFSM